MHRHVRDTVVIVKESSLPHPHCTLCDMIVLYASMNRRNLNTAQCSKVADSKHHRVAVEEA